MNHQLLSMKIKKYARTRLQNLYHKTPKNNINKNNLRVFKFKFLLLRWYSS